MATTTVYPNGDGTVTNWTNESSGSSNLYQSIDEGTASPNDADYIQTTTTGITRYFLLGDMPSDFVNATAVTIKIRCNTSTSKGDFLNINYVQLVQSDQSTAITGQSTFSDTTSITTFSLSPSITGGTSKTVWDGARLAISTQGTSGTVKVYAVQVEITYSTSSPLPPQGGMPYVYVNIFELLEDDTDFGIYGTATTSAVLQSGMLLWNTYSSTIDTSQYVWNVYSSTLDSNQLIWNTYSSILDTNQYIWNVYSSVSDNNQLIWNTYSSVSDTNRYVWNVYSSISDTNQYIWNTYSGTISSNQYLWNTYSSTQDTISYLWNTYSSVQDSNQYVWNTYSGTQKTNQYIWDVKAQILDDLNLTWNTYSSVLDSTNYIWNTYSGVNQSNTYLWNVRQYINDTINLLWNVEGELVQFQIYNIALYVTKNKALASYVTQEVLKELKVRRGFSI